MCTLPAGVVFPALVGVVPSIEMVIWAAIGGRTYLMGGIVGTLLVNFAKDKISTALPELWLYALGLLFIIAVTALPRGIVGAYIGRASCRERVCQYVKISVVEVIIKKQRSRQTLIPITS